jgi:hypothetical protein
MREPAPAGFRGIRKFTAFHSAVLVFFLDAAGSCFIRGCTPGFSNLWLIAWMAFFGLSFWGWGLLLLQRRDGVHYLVFGALLAGVNAGWALATLLLRDRDDVLRPGFLWVAGVLCGLGMLVAAHALKTRTRPARGS